MVKRLRRSPLKAQSGVRFSLGSPQKQRSCHNDNSFCFSDFVYSGSALSGDFSGGASSSGNVFPALFVLEKSLFSSSSMILCLLSISRSSGSTFAAGALLPGLCGAGVSEGAFLISFYSWFSGAGLVFTLDTFDRTGRIARAAAIPTVGFCR